MAFMKRFILALAALSLPLIGTVESRAAQAPYDGLWSVLIITDKGTCDRGYRYAIRINRGRVAHADQANSSFNIRGAVGGNGGIRVSVSRGDRRADGTGRLSRTGGGGKWRSSNGECSGTWQAERRGG